MDDLARDRPPAPGPELGGEPAEWAVLDRQTAAELAIEGVEPRWHCVPATVDGAAQAVAVARARGLSVIPRGAGTAMTLGFPPRSADLVLQTTRLNRVIAYEPADLTVTVEAGVSLGELQRLLAAEGQLLPLDPPVPDEATLGGIIATNASGPLRLAHGTARDLVIGTRVVTADGLVARAGGRVVKNVAGYDLNKLHIGALGTLGLVVELSFKVLPRPARQATVVAAFAEPLAAAHAIRAVLRSPLSPQSLALLDERAAAAVGLEGRPGQLALLARAAGLDSAVRRQLRDLAALCRQHGADVPEPPPDEAELWQRVRRLAAPSPRSSGALFLAKVSVPIVETVPMLLALAEGASREGLTVRTFAHAGSGIIYGGLKHPALDSTELEAVSRWLVAARAAAVARGGSLVVEAAPMALKERIDVWGDVGPAFQVMVALKRELDPTATFNSGRFIGRL